MIGSYIDGFKLQRRKFTPNSQLQYVALHSFKLQRRKFTLWKILRYRWDDRVSNSSGGNLHDGVRDGIDQFIRFQTPAEEIYTERMSYPCPEYLISNSSGGNLHDGVRDGIDQFIRFQTPAEEIYTPLRGLGLLPCGDFKLHRRKFTPAWMFASARHRRISNSSGGNLHLARKSGKTRLSYFKLQRRKFTQR